MALYDVIRSDHQIARVRKSSSVPILTTLLGELQLAQTVDQSGAKRVDDETVQRIVAKFVKNNKESLAIRPDPALEEEITVLTAYLPKQLDEDELTTIISGLVDDGATNVGQIMASLKTTHAGQYDGKLASAIIKRITSAS